MVLLRPHEGNRRVTPADLKNETIPVAGRGVAPVITVPLTGLGPDGRAHTIDGPPIGATPIGAA